MNSFFSYGLPLGSALIVAAFMVIVASWKATLELADLTFGMLQLPFEVAESAFQIKVNFVLRISEFALHAGLLVYGVISKGQSVCLLSWIVFQGIFLFIWEAEIIWSLMDSSAHLGFGSIIFFMYIMLCMLVQYGYPMYLAFNCLPAFESIVDLEPVGKGFKVIFEFYVSNTWTCASVALMMEVVLNVYFLFEDHVAKFGFTFRFAGSQSTADEIEEGVIRFARLILCTIGFYFVQKENKKSLFTWCFSYFITLLLSGGLFIYMVFAWRYANTVRTFQYFLSFVISLIYRTVALIACLRYSGFFEVNGISLGTTV